MVQDRALATAVDVEGGKNRPQLNKKASPEQEALFLFGGVPGSCLH
jgi:hypothetical protein